VLIGGSEGRLATSQHCMAASRSGSVDTSPTVVTAAAAACSVTSWSSRDVQAWLHNNDLDSLVDRFLLNLPSFISLLEWFLFLTFLPYFYSSMYIETFHQGVTVQLLLQQ